NRDHDAWREFHRRPPSGAQPASAKISRRRARRAGGKTWLSGLTTDQDEVYQAVGMIMAQLGTDAEEALARLRASAFAQGRTALDVAHEVITHRKRFDRD
ncbi:hypothetical protein C1I97_36440, partial [Streptomyces sp. NTH33]|uniref:ANTAR domain-containing protein n=1 Tax=Streptomyces sp. NTH33 TaxID=1735453 RepID=UPI000DAFF540